MNKKLLQYYTGCLVGGAIGDALGAPIEFQSLEYILHKNGPSGVNDYIEYGNGKGEITDDTQMLLFTAEGLLRSIHKASTDAVAPNFVPICHHSYLRWLITQDDWHMQLAFLNINTEGWFMKQEHLLKRRAPGTTCLESLRSKYCGTMQKPLNNSKGCGGIMRIAPVGLISLPDAATAFKVGAELAAITHSHPSGYLSAGCFAAIIHLINQGTDLMEAVNTTIDILVKYPQHGETLTAIERALDLYKQGNPEYHKIINLGEGWTGEEALSIALYTSLSYQNDFEKAVNLSINHSGDCDSTGALTGNIMGLLLGVNSIPERWISNLKNVEFVQQVAADLYTELDKENLVEWATKYPAY